MSSYTVKLLTNEELESVDSCNCRVLIEAMQKEINQNREAISCLIDYIGYETSMDITMSSGIQTPCTPSTEEALYSSGEQSLTEILWMLSEDEISSDMDITGLDFNK